MAHLLVDLPIEKMVDLSIAMFQWIGLRENLQETPWFPVDFPLNQSIEC